MNTQLKQQIEAAFNYRGNVTLTKKDGSTTEGFVFNREFDHSTIEENQFVEIFLAGSGAPCKLTVAELESVELTGEDHAAGKSYEEWLKKQN